MKVPDNCAPVVLEYVERLIKAEARIKALEKVADAANELVREAEKSLTIDADPAYAAGKLEDALAELEAK